MLQDRIDQSAEEKTRWLLDKNGGLRGVRDLLMEALNINFDMANRLAEDIAEKCRGYTLARITQNIEIDMMKGGQ
jgi:hypothetical protein